MDRNSADVALPPGSAAIGLCRATDGAIYYQSGTRNALGRLDPATLQVREIHLPLALSYPSELNAARTAPSG